MKKTAFIITILLPFALINIPPASAQKDLPKIAVWGLEPRNVPATHARELTSILVSEIAKVKVYEVYSQENVRTLAGWTAERMTLGCTDTKCLTALGQMDISKLISGSVGRIGNTFSISLNLFDTQNAKSEKAVSEFCRIEDELIPLVQVAVRNLLAVKVAPTRVEQRPSISTVGEIARDGRFIAYSNGTVLDTQTGLMWAAKDNGYDIDWYGAKEYCENYRGDGYRNWRMPTLDELEQLYDNNKSYKAKQGILDGCLAEFIELTKCWLWTAEVSRSVHGSYASIFAFDVRWRSSVNLSYSYSTSARVLPVRSAK
jgi:hypothetical protein